MDKWLFWYVIAVSLLLVAYTAKEVVQQSCVEPASQPKTSVPVGINHFVVEV